MKTHSEVGLFTLFCYGDNNFSNWVLILLFAAQACVPWVVFLNSAGLYRESDKSWCEGNAPWGERVAGALIGAIFNGLAFFRFSCYGSPSDFFKSSTDGARKAITIDLFMALVYREFIHVASYLWILFAEADARAMIINSGALEFWVFLDINAKELYLTAFPRRNLKILRKSIMRTQAGVPAEAGSWLWPFKVGSWLWPLGIVVLGFTLAMAIYLPLCKPDFDIMVLRHN